MVNEETSALNWCGGFEAFSMMSFRRQADADGPQSQGPKRVASQSLDPLSVPESMAGSRIEEGDSRGDSP